MEGFKKTEGKEEGICCKNCQENVNIHGCFLCGKRFYDMQEIYCKYNRSEDSNHLHKECLKQMEDGLPPTAKAMGIRPTIL